MKPFDTSQDYFLEDGRALLRPLRPADIEHLAHFAIREPEIWTYSLSAINSPEMLSNYITDACIAREAGKEYPFVVFDKEKEAYAGSTRFYDIQTFHETLQLGYTWYGKDFQGTGLNRHCKYLLLDFAFEALGMARVEFRADYRNKRSIAAMKAIGCVEEGVLRSNTILPGGLRRDSIVLSILRNEWYGRVREMLAGKVYI